jgi:hypothetical protein
LRDLLRDYTPLSTPWRRQETETALRRQRKILAALPDFPGYRLTAQAQLDLIVDIHDLAERLEQRLQRNVFAVMRRIVLDVISTLLRMRTDGLLALPTGY